MLSRHSILFSLLCAYLILFPATIVGVSAAVPVVPLAVVPASSRTSNAKNNSSRPSTPPLNQHPQQQQQQNQPQQTASTMYGSEEQPATDDHQSTVVSSTQQQLKQQKMVDGNGTAVAVVAAVPDVVVSTNPPPRQQLQPQQRDPIYMWSSLAAGVGSGALASMLCAPLDLVRTRMQVWGQVVRSKNGAAFTGSTSLTGMLREIIQRDGWRGCFRGLGATLVTVPFFWGVYFPLYDDFKRHWTSRNPDANPVWIHMGSAVLAGAISDVICNPMFVVRTRLQTEALHDLVERSGQVIRPKGMIQTAKSLYGEGGPLVFWRGMTANLMGLSHVAIQFPVYEMLKKKFRHDKEHESATDLLLASGLSKMTASMISYPHEVIRSRMMDARAGPLGFVQTCQHIYLQEGMSGFYAGLPVSMIRVIPNTCITFLTYEMILRYARTKIREHRSSNGTSRQ